MSSYLQEYRRKKAELVKIKEEKEKELKQQEKELKQQENNMRVNEAYEEYIRKHYASGANYQPILSKRMMRSMITGNSSWHPENEGYLMGSRHHSLAPGGKEVIDPPAFGPYMASKLGEKVVRYINQHKLNQSNTEENESNENDEPNMNEFTTTAKGLSRLIKGARGKVKEAARGVKGYLTRKPKRYNIKGKELFSKNNIRQAYINRYGFDPNASYEVSLSQYPTLSPGLYESSYQNYLGGPWIERTAESSANPWGSEFTIPNGASNFGKGASNWKPTLQAHHEATKGRGGYSRKTTSKKKRYTRRR
jgi:hypothetical protein